MQNTMKKIITLFVFVSSCLGISAQNTGYAGKHFILKTDAYNGRFLGGRNAELEYVVARRFSVTAGFRYLSGQYKQKFSSEEADALGSDDYFSSGEIKAVNSGNPLATIKTYSVKIQVKYYLNKIVPAPKGFFFYGSVEVGEASLSNAVTLSYFDYSSYGDDILYAIPAPRMEGINTKQYEIGGGYQEILWGRFVVEGSLAMNIARFNGNGGSTTKYTAAVARSYGPNLLPLGKSASDTFHSGDYVGSFGLALYIKVGVLVF